MVRSSSGSLAHCTRDARKQLAAIYVALEGFIGFDTLLGNKGFSVIRTGRAGGLAEYTNIGNKGFSDIRTGRAVRSGANDGLYRVQYTFGE